MHGVHSVNNTDAFNAAVGLSDETESCRMKYEHTNWIKRVKKAGTSYHKALSGH